MKLKNKKTGEIVTILSVSQDGFTLRENSGRTFFINSLAQLIEDYEDYEEPEGWCVTMYGGISHITKNDEILIPSLKEIGNYFNDKESAYDALDKLKAWKRLKDKGFRFDCYMRRSDWAGLSEVKALENLIDITAYLPKDKIKEMEVDLDLLFGGEE